MDEKNQDKTLSLIEHLEELRERLIKSIIAVIIAAGVSFRYVKKLLPYLIQPVGKVVFLSPQEALLTHVKLALIGGVILASPVILFQVWQFVSCALKPEEKRWVLIFGPLSLFFFLAGAFFGYRVILPLGLKFLLSFSSPELVPMLSVGRYLPFIFFLVLVFGVVFELPVFLYFLTLTGIVTPSLLRRRRKHAIVLIFILAAIFTPPDVVTQSLLAIPLIFLYEIGIIFSRLAYRRRGG